MATIELKGFKLLASGMLPLEKGSLVYGSNDAGITIHYESPQLNSLLQQAAKEMNIKPHLCGPSKSKSKLMYSCVDLEGHLGSDNRFYLLVKKKIFFTHFFLHFF